MILPKGWRKAASEAWKDEAENAGAFADESPKSNFMNGFEQGANEYANAVEDKLKELIAVAEVNIGYSLTDESELRYQGEKNALQDFLSDLSNLTPLK